MDRSVRDTSSGNGEHSSCYCFRGTCQICAPSIKTSKTKTSTFKKTETGENTNE